MSHKLIVVAVLSILALVKDDSVSVVHSPDPQFLSLVLKLVTIYLQVYISSVRDIVINFV